MSSRPLILHILVMHPDLSSENGENLRHTHRRDHAERDCGHSPRYQGARKSARQLRREVGA